MSVGLSAIETEGLVCHSMPMLWYFS